MEKRKINKVVVVEGRDDTANLRRFYDVETYETGGSAIDDVDIERLVRLQAARGIIVFTDPDFQGERIRKLIMAAIPEAEHAFLQRDEARPKGKGSLGVEHAGFAALDKALSGLSGGVPADRELSDGLTAADLAQFGLTGASDSRRRREFLCQALRIGYANGKQLRKRLALFGVSREQIEEAMKGYGD